MSGGDSVQETEWLQRRWQSHLKRNPHITNNRTSVQLRSARPLPDSNGYLDQILPDNNMEAERVSQPSEDKSMKNSVGLITNQIRGDGRPAAKPRKPWSTVAGIVNKTDENTNIVAAGTFGEMQVDQRLFKIKDKYQRREDAVKVLEKLEENSTKWYSLANNMQSEEFILTFLSGGSWFIKINDKHKTYKRFFYYEKHRKMIYYEGSKKRTKGKRLPRYDSREILDVRQGHQTDVFNKNDGKYQEDCCFSIIMSGRTPINLVADHAEIADLWVRGIKFLIYANDRLQKLHDEKQWIADYFYSADANNDGTLEFEEVWYLLQKMSVKMSKKDAKAKFHTSRNSKSADQDKVKDNKGNLTLTLEEFGQFYHDICKRDDVEKLFKECSSHPHGQIMNVEDMQGFMTNQQGCSYTDNEIRQLIERFEPSAAKRKLRQLSFNGFLFLINSNIMNIRNPEHNEVYHDMTQPLSSYYISSSHNTYLLEDQLKGPSSIEGYIKALMSGCRCVELDCWDGDVGPVVYHGYTLTSKILFKDIIEDAIRHYAFYKTRYPLILSLENHCSIEQQQKMADILIDVLGDMLHTEPINPDTTTLPSPDELKGKILIKCRKLPAGVSDDQSTVAEEDSDDELNVTTSDDAEVKEMLKHKKKGKMKLAKKLSDLVTYVQSVPFHGFSVVRRQGKPYEMSSYSEKKALKLIDDEAGEFTKHTNYQLCRIYPAGTRTDSSNYSPMDMWNVGCQLVSLNFQTSDRAMQLYRGRFKDNGSCGYLLKPSFMREENITFDPRAGVFPESWGRRYTIQVLSGSHLPKPEGDQNTSDLVDPYVKLEIYGVKEDCMKCETNTVADNGLNPHWNETFEFFLSVPELAILRVNVKDHETLTTNDSIGQCSLPVTSIQQGYRHVMLETSEGLNLCPASVFVHIDIKPMSKGTWHSKKSVVSGFKQLLGNATLVNGKSVSKDSGETSDLSRQSSIRS